MMGQGGISSTEQVTFNASNLTWTEITSTGKANTYPKRDSAFFPTVRF